MAYGSNPGPASGGGGNEDYYSDGPAKAEEASGGDEEAKADDGANETTIPKSMLMGKDFKVGEEVMFQITAIHGEEVRIKYATEKGESEEKGEGEEASAGAPPPKGDAEMSSMMY